MANYLDENGLEVLVGLTREKIYTDVSEVKETADEAKVTADAAKEAADKAVQTVEVGTTTTGDAGTKAAVENSGTTQDVVLDFTIPKGDQGEDGEQGPQGEQGEPGEDGYSPTVDVKKVGKITTITITDKDGEHSAEILDGEDGTTSEGGTGADGYSPTVSVSKSDGVTTIVITDVNGEHTATINDGEQGPEGPQGPQGEQGEKGDKGDTGAAGADGKDGTAYYGTCSTAASTAAKVVTCSGFTLETGATICVCFTNANSASSPTMNVNSTGAKSITAYGTTAANTYTWRAGGVMIFTYDGTSWVINNFSVASTSYYGVTKLSDSTSSTSTSLAATANAVGTAYSLANAANTTADSAASAAASAQSTAQEASDEISDLKDMSISTSSGSTLSSTFGFETIGIPRTLNDDGSYKSAFDTIKDYWEQLETRKAYIAFINPQQQYVAIIQKYTGDHNYGSVIIQGYGFSTPRYYRISNGTWYEVTLADNASLTDGSVTKVGTSTIGGAAKPIYLSSGTPTACSSTVGSGTQPAYLASGTITACGTTVGSSTKPIYSSSGVLTACSTTVGSGTKPIYSSSGTLTASSSTVGSSTNPVYLNSGTVTACSMSDMLIIETVSASSSTSVSASSTSSITISYSKSGYTVLGVVGWYVGGDYSTNANIYRCRWSSSNGVVQFYVRNISSSNALTITPTVDLLLLKTS